MTRTHSFITPALAETLVAALIGALLYFGTALPL
jgi:hypothetical protein